MPELPEVTVISEDVAELAVGREVLRAAVFRPDVTNVEPEEFGRLLVGRTLRATGRRGKIIILDFGEVVGLVHLVISGRVLRLPEWREPDRMNTAVLEFGGGPLVLAFTRLWLGYFDLYEPGEEERHPLISRLPRPLLQGLHGRIPGLSLGPQGGCEGPASRSVRCGRPRQHLRGRNPVLSPCPPRAKGKHTYQR